MRIGPKTAKLTTPAVTASTFKADGGPAKIDAQHLKGGAIETVDFNPPIMRAKCDPATGEPDVYRHALLIRIPSRSGKGVDGKPWATRERDAVALFSGEAHVRIACTASTGECRDGGVRTIDVADFMAVLKSGLVKP